MRRFEFRQGEGSDLQDAAFIFQIASRLPGKIGTRARFRGALALPGLPAGSDGWVPPSPRSSLPANAGDHIRRAPGSCEPEVPRGRLCSGIWGRDQRPGSAFVKPFPWPLGWL